MAPASIRKVSLFWVSASLVRMVVEGLGGIRGTGPAKMGSTWRAMLPGLAGAGTDVISEAGITWGKAPIGAGGGVGQGGTWARAG